MVKRTLLFGAADRLRAPNSYGRLTVKCTTAVLLWVRSHIAKLALLNALYSPRLVVLGVLKLHLSK